MADYYCKKCDKEGVGGFHRCFMPYQLDRIKPLKKRPHPNTPLARRLAKLYEECWDEPFPGGIENAKIDRDRAAAHRAWRDTGGWVWYLWPIDVAHGYPRNFGSSYTTKECLKDMSKFSTDPDLHTSAFMDTQK